MVMAPDKENDRVEEVARAAAEQFAGMAELGDVQPWEQIGSDRYMPRRIKGSCKGRALG
jgi:hypothetical protein